MNITQKLGTLAVVAIAGSAHAGLETTTIVSDFDDGTFQGWQGPQGIGGATFIDETGGVDGSGAMRTEFNNFGIQFENDTDQFVQDLTQFESVTLSVDVKVDRVGSFLPVTRPWIVEFRDFDNVEGDHPWSSVFFSFEGGISEQNNSEFTTFSVTIDNPSSEVLPEGWRGFGSEAPNGASALPESLTFADILSGFDEIAFSTLEPDYFFTFDDFYVNLDNITLTTTVPAPGSSALLAAGGVFALRRRR